MTTAALLPAQHQQQCNARYKADNHMARPAVSDKYDGHQHNIRKEEIPYLNQPPLLVEKLRIIFHLSLQIQKVIPPDFQCPV